MINTINNLLEQNINIGESLSVTNDDQQTNFKPLIVKEEDLELESEANSLRHLM